MESIGMFFTLEFEAAFINHPTLTLIANFSRCLRIHDLSQTEAKAQPEAQTQETKGKQEEADEKEKICGAV